jgi:hypothetical protein
VCAVGWLVCASIHFQFGAARLLASCSHPISSAFLFSPPHLLTELFFFLRISCIVASHRRLRIITHKPTRIRYPRNSGCRVNRPIALGRIKVCPFIPSSPHPPSLLLYFHSFALRITHSHSIPLHPTLFSFSSLLFCSLVRLCSVSVRYSYGFSVRAALDPPSTSKIIRGTWTCTYTFPPSPIHKNSLTD